MIGVGGAGALAATWRDDILEASLLGAGSWLADVMSDGGGGLFLLRLLECLEVVVAEDLEWALDLLLFGVPGGGAVSGEVPCL